MGKLHCLKWPGLLLLVIGVVIVLACEDVLTYFLNKELSLSPTSQVFPIWEKPQLPIVLDIYLFNCTNTEELSRDFKPNFQEVGPFRFREYQNKVNLTWNDNDTVTYRQQRFFYFDEEESVSAMEENITMLNMPPVIASHKAKNLGNFASFSLSFSMKVLEKSIWVTKSIKEFLFEGYSDPLLTLSSVFSGGANNKVGFFYGRNTSFTKDGYFNMETGAKDISKIGILRQWNFDNRTYSYGEGCDDVRGYAGNFFPHKMSKEPFEFFSGDICKPINFFYNEEVEMFGLKGYKYFPDESLMDNGYTNPDSACNCGGDVCMPSGVLNLTGCMEGIPMFASLPHFLHADPAYLENVTGLVPDVNRSNSHIIIEPNLGIPIELTAHIQYNVLLQRNPKISLFDDVPNVVFPLFWVKKRVVISEETAQQIKTILYLPTLGTNVAITLILTGILMILVSLIPRCIKITGRTPEMRKRKSVREFSFSKSNGMVFNKEDDDNEKELMKNYMNGLSKEDKLNLLNSKETDILT